MSFLEKVGNGLRQVYGAIQCLTDDHDYDWTYVDESCSATGVCRRCGETTGGPHHPWGEWYYLSEGSCEKIRECSRNHEIEIFDDLHQWSAPRLSPSEHEFPVTCIRCGARDRNPHQYHHYGPPEILPSCKRGYSCQTCGDGRNFEHHEWEFVREGSELRRRCRNPNHIDSAVR